MNFPRLSELCRVTARGFFILCCFAVFCAVRADQPSKVGGSEVRPFQSGDRVVFLGDSITKGGSYHELLEIFYAVRFPERAVEFLNCGVGGDRASAILSAWSFRVETDVLALKPTVVAVMLGMNDVERSLYRDEPVSPSNEAARKLALEEYRTSLGSLVQKLQNAGPRVIVFSPPVYEESTALSQPERLPGVNAALAVCAGIAREIARAYGAEFVDVHGAMDAANRSQQAVEPEFSITGAGQSWNDRVHPGPVGHYVIAHAVLTAQGLLGAPVGLPKPGCRVPGYPDLPKALLDLGDERRRIAERLREPATYRYLMAKERHEPNSSDAFLLWLTEKRAALEAAGKKAPWITSVLEILPREVELRSQVESLALKIRQSAALQ
jgi:lysophospholipase L1-like esterase